MREVFVGSEAVAQGTLTEYQLRRWYRSIFRDVYVPKRRVVSLRDRIEGAWLRSGRRGVIAGVAASALHGAPWVDDDVPIELVWSNTRSPSGLLARTETLAPDEITQVARLPVTTVVRTAYDLGRQLPRDEAVARLDALGWATPFAIDDVLRLARRHPRARGLRRLRSTLPLVDFGADSPKETWLRLLLIDAGLPRPTTQIPVQVNWRLVGVLDMGWEDYRVAVEYDGDHHRKDRKQYVKDRRRLRRLAKLGWIIIRVIAEDEPADVIAWVTEALIKRGWRPECALAA